uniref:Uncharacterized protein n=1 Tax=Schistocephalus solidus TaxID=70667 RepID=A0A0V0JB11_SCHSO
MENTGSSHDYAPPIRGGLELNPPEIRIRHECKVRATFMLRVTIRIGGGFHRKVTCIAIWLHMSVSFPEAKGKKMRGKRSIQRNISDNIHSLLNCRHCQHTIHFSHQPHGSPLQSNSSSYSTRTMKESREKNMEKYRSAHRQFHN